MIKREFFYNHRNYYHLLTGLHYVYLFVYNISSHPISLIIKKQKQLLKHQFMIFTKYPRMMINHFPFLINIYYILEQHIQCLLGHFSEIVIICWVTFKTWSNCRNSILLLVCKKWEQMRFFSNIVHWKKFSSQLSYWYINTIPGGTSCINSNTAVSSENKEKCL